MGNDISTPVKKKDSKKSKVINELQQVTGMGKDELRSWYDKFMEDNPSGHITREDFIKAYEESSPASAEFGERIFDAYDLDGNGFVDVKEFVVTVNLASRGTVQEKLAWAFDLYDRDRDDFITRQEAEDIIFAIYEMDGSEDPMGKARETTAELFLKIDRNNDNLLSREEFLAGARSAHIIGKLLPGC